MLNHLQINFDPSSLMLLNFVLAFMMFGVSLSLKPSDFGHILKKPIAPSIGLFAQFLILPAVTCAITVLFNIDPGFALGMILVASCPGGSFSNIMTYIAKGNLAVSVSMTAVSSVAALILTPINFAFWASINPNTAPLLQSITVSTGQLIQLIAIVLVAPLFLGMIIGHKWQNLSSIIEPWLRKLSLIIFLAFVLISFGNNSDLFVKYFHLFATLVIAHNAIALLIGFGLATLGRVSRADRRAITLETGIQNSGLGLILLFNFFPDQGSMMIITAFWGIWHLVSGSLLAFYWSRRKLGLAPQV